MLNLWVAYTIISKTERLRFGRIGTTRRPAGTPMSASLGSVCDKMCNDAMFECSSAHAIRAVRVELAGKY